MVSLPLSFFHFHLSPMEALHLPQYKGFILRGGLGAAFHRMVCPDVRRVCTDCILKTGCAYAYIFETPRLAKEAIQREASHDPHPFVIEPPLEAKQEYLPGEELIFKLILIGKAIDYLPYFIVAFEELGRRGIGKERGEFQLTKVECLDTSGGRELVYEEKTLFLSQGLGVRIPADIEEEAKSLAPNSITLHFLTPTRIKQKPVVEGPESPLDKRRSKLVKNIDFPLFLRNLLRRLSWLAEAHCGEKWGQDYQGLLARAESIKTTSADLTWHDWEGYSRRQNTRLKMGGFMGSITFEGDLAEFLPFIKLGEYLHIGKGTAYGLGKYQIRSL